MMDAMVFKDEFQPSSVQLRNVRAAMFPSSRYYIPAEQHQRNFLHPYRTRISISPT